VRPRLLAWLAVAAVVVLAAVIRLRLLDVPLDRDEGEYAYFGQLLLAGVPPYAQAYNLKLPGIYGAYALIMAIFGQTPSAIRGGLILTTSASTVAAYVLGARLGGSTIGVAAAGVFAALSLNPKMLGIAAYVSSPSRPIGGCAPRRRPAEMSCQMLSFAPLALKRPF